MRGPKTKGQGNGYIICKEVKIGDKRAGGGGRGEVKEKSACPDFPSSQTSALPLHHISEIQG